MRITVSGKTIKIVERLPFCHLCWNSKADWQASQFAMIYTRFLVLSKLKFWKFGSSPHSKIKAPAYLGLPVNAGPLLLLSAKPGFLQGEEGLRKGEFWELETEPKEVWLYGALLDFPEPKRLKKTEVCSRVKDKMRRGPGERRSWQSRGSSSHRGSRVELMLPQPLHVLKTALWKILNVCKNGMIPGTHPSPALATIHGEAWPLLTAHFICPSSKRYHWKLRSIKRSWGAGWLWQHTPLVPAPERQRQTDFCEFKARQSYMGRPYFRRENKKMLRRTPVLRSLRNTPLQGI